MADHPFTRWGPAEQWQGLRAAVCDPRLPNATSAPTAGVISLFEVYVPEDFLCSTVHLNIATTAGVTLANSFVGIYDDLGNLIARSGDQSSAWQSTGNKAVPLLSPVALQGQRRYYVAILIGSAATLPTFTRGANVAAVNIGAAAPFRSSTSGSGLTALPATISYAGVAASNIGWWGGLS